MPWNNPSVIAPNFQKLAHEGTIMTDFYVQPVCTPSRSALMTSRNGFSITAYPQYSEHSPVDNGGAQA